MRNDILNLKEQIEQYIPYNEQEANDKHVMLQYINKFDDAHVLTSKKIPRTNSSLRDEFIRGSTLLKGQCPSLWRKTPCT